MAFRETSITQHKPTRMGAVIGATAPVDIHFQAHRELGSKEVIAFQGIDHWNDVFANWLLSPTDASSTTQEALERAINLALATHCARAAYGWRSQGFNIDVWITLHAQALLDPKFSTELLTCVLLEQVEPDWLVLEVDEVALAAVGDLAINTLEVLSGLGFKIALSATGAPIFPFDKRMRALFSYLKHNGSSARALKRATKSREARAFARRMQAVRAAGIPVIASEIGSKDRKSAYRSIGFTRFQSGLKAKAMTFETATKRLYEQTFAARIQTPTLPQALWSSDLLGQSVEDVLVNNLRRTQQSMLRFISLDSAPNTSMDTNKAA
jgi:EAL domain-containing protein (putative c-di-GMP-specific phosphodiesterase class I)